MYHKLNHYLEVNNILVAEQYRYRKGLSTENVGYILIDNILKAWNSKFHVGGTFCCIVKASNCENHEILIIKLLYYGLQEENIVSDLI
jgi:hypothetical protein